MTPARARARLRRVRRLLRGAHGGRSFTAGSAAVGQLVGTILSQNTTSANAGEGLRRLRREFRSWTALADAPVRRIERCIRICGLSRLKAPRIRNALRRVRGDRGRVSLEFLRRLPADRARQYLLDLDGVGPKTAACVLLFAFGKEVFPVDTHVRRIAARLGLVAERTSAERTQEMLTPLIDPPARYELHVLLIAHGRAVCRAQRPRCRECCLLSLCPTGRSQTG